MVIARGMPLAALLTVVGFGVGGALGHAKPDTGLTFSAAAGVGSVALLTEALHGFSRVGGLVGAGLFAGLSIGSLVGAAAAIDDAVRGAADATAP